MDYRQSLKRKRNPTSMSEVAIANKRAFKRAVSSMALAIPSGTTQQAMRTGGWANPSRMKGELKFKDTTVIIACPASSTVIQAGVLLNGLVPGSGADQRIGRKVVLKSILFRWTTQLSSSSTLGGSVRIIIVYDKQANAVAAAPSDIFSTAGPDFNSPNNLSNRDRFVTLSDTITSPMSAQGDWAQCGVIYKRINLETMFNSGNAGTINDITTGSIYVYAAQSGSIGTAAVNLFATARVRYEDN